MSETKESGTGIGVHLVLTLVVLACGHMLSNLVRTLPAIAVDVIAPDLGATAHEVASLTAAYHFSFAICQLPIGAALDRFSVRSVSLTLFGGTIVGSILAAISTGPLSFLIAQLVLGMATSGMLMCPMALAARALSPVQFGLWSGIILSLGNMGMLLSASPLAWVVDGFGWRAGFWVAMFLGFLIAAAVLAYVPNERPPQTKKRPLLHEMVEVVRLALSPTLRGLVILSLTSTAVMLVLRGLWGGPWLMDVKGLSRLDAGNILFVFTLAMIIGPFLIGLADSRLKRRRALIAGTHFGVGAGFLLMAAGGPGGIMSLLFAVRQMPTSYDVVLLIALGLLMSAPPLIYAMTRQAVAAENTGKALSAINLAFFLGTAMMQSATDPIAGRWGLSAVMLFMGGSVLVATLAFLWFTRAAR